MSKSEKIIQEYKNAYYNMHGRYPEMRQKGSWIYINESPTAHRISQLPEYITNLILSGVPEQHDEEFTTRKLLSAIKVDGRNIFRSNNLKEMRKAGKRIAKIASRLLNRMDDETLESR